MTSCPDELEADFQQYYGINFEDAFEDYSVRHVSTLAAQLPETSRCLGSITDHEWTQQMQMLANIEHELRILIWIQENQGSKRKSKFPKRIESPAKTIKVERKLEATNLDELNEAFGIKVEG